MALLVPIAACNLSTANAFYTGDVCNNSCLSSTGLALDTTGINPINVTFATTDTLQGVVLMLRTVQNIGTAATLTAQLQENVATVWTNRGTAVVVTSGTMLQGYNTTLEAVREHIMVDFRGINYAVDTTAGKWRIKLTASATNNFTIHTSNATAHTFWTYMATTRSYAANDLLICVQQVTQDVDATFRGILGTGDAANASALWIGYPSTLSTLTTPQPMFLPDVTAPRTLTIDGMVRIPFHSCWTIGTSASPVTIANKYSINFPAPTFGTQSGIFRGEANTSWNAAGCQTILWYGTPPTVRKATIYADIAVGATTIQVTEDVTSWLSGALISIGKQNVLGQQEAKPYTISGVPTYDGVKSTITLSGAITTYARKAWTALSGVGTVFLIDQNSIVVTGNTTRLGLYNMQIPSNFEEVGVSWINFSNIHNNVLGNTGSQDLAANRSQWRIENCTAGRTLLNGTVVFNTPAIPREGYITRGCYIQSGNFSGATSAVSTAACFSNSLGENIVSDNITHCAPGSTSFDFNQFTTIDNNIVENGLYTIGVRGFNNSFTNFYGWCLDPAASGVTLGALLFGASNSNGASYLTSCRAISNIRLNKCRNAFGFLGVVVPGVDDTGSHLGDDTANVSDVYFATNALVNYRMTGSFGNLNISSTYSAAARGSKFRVDDFNSVSGDNRAWYTEGVFTSSGSLLQAENAISGVLLDPIYNVTTAATSTYKHGFQVNCLIGFAAYYAGTYTLPTMKVTYDLTSTQTAVASASTAQQVLSLFVTPTTNSNPMPVEFRTLTDSSLANSLVTWDTLINNVRGYGYVYSTATIDINKTTDLAVNTNATPVTNPFITQTTRATVAAYTGIAVNHTTQTVTLTVAHTLQELYDYAQYDLSEDANFFTADWFTTLNGVDYTSTYDIVVNNCALTGGGSIDVGTNTFTRSGTGTYDGYVITSTNRSLHVLLNTLVSGSTVQIYDTTTSTELYNAVVAATSLDYLFTYTADHTLRIRVRKTGEIPYEYSGTITNTGFSLNVSQVTDDVYVYNAITGSTVTEVYLTGSTLLVYVDDVDNATTAQRIYARYMYDISSTSYIGLQPYDITANTPFDYVLADAIKIYNVDTSNPLMVSGANVNNVTGNGLVIDTAGGSINFISYYPIKSNDDLAAAIWTTPVSQYSTADGTFGNEVLTKQRFKSLHPIE